MCARVDGDILMPHLFLPDYRDSAMYILLLSHANGIQLSAFTHTHVHTTPLHGKSIIDKARLMLHNVARKQFFSLSG